MMPQNSEQNKNPRHLFISNGRGKASLQLLSDKFDKKIYNTCKN